MEFNISSQAFPAQKQEVSKANPDQADLHVMGNAKRKKRRGKLKKVKQPVMTFGF